MGLVKFHEKWPMYGSQLYLSTEVTSSADSMECESLLWRWMHTHTEYSTMNVEAALLAQLEYNINLRETLILYLYMKQKLMPFNWNTIYKKIGKLWFLTLGYLAEIFLKVKKVSLDDVVMHTCNPRTLEAEAGGYKVWV